MGQGPSIHLTALPPISTGPFLPLKAWRRERPSIDKGWSEGRATRLSTWYSPLLKELSTKSVQRPVRNYAGGSSPLTLNTCISGVPATLCAQLRFGQWLRPYRPATLLLVTSNLRSLRTNVSQPLDENYIYHLVFSYATLKAMLRAPRRRIGRVLCLDSRRLVAPCCIAYRS